MVQVNVQNTLSPEYLHSESNHKVFRRIIVLWCNDGIFAAKIRKTTLNLFSQVCSNYIPVVMLLS